MGAAWPKARAPKAAGTSSPCRCGASGQLCLGFGVTDTLVQDRATKQTTSKACPTVLGEGNKFCPRGSSLLLKTQRQN